MLRILKLIEDVKDPRMSGKIKHNFGSIIFVTLCGILSGCESWGDIHDYCSVKRDWLQRYVDLSSGIPSEWTFRRIFTLLDPSFLEHLLRTHASEAVLQGKKSDQIAVDGKAVRGSKRQGMQCLHSVSAWCHENGLVLAEEQVNAKSNEITAIPLLLESLDLKDTTISIDAAGCQKSIAEMIRNKQGHFVLGLKRNQPNLYNAVNDYIRQQGENDDNRLYDAFDHSHGRSVRRRYFGYDLTSLPEAKEWRDARSVVAVETITSYNNDSERKTTAEWRYYLSSHTSNNRKIPEYIRNHWGIENKLHWILDVHLKEDNDQKAERKSVRSFALLKRIALNIVRTKDTLSKKSIKRKLKNAAWNNDYLLSLLI